MRTLATIQPPPTPKYLGRPRQAAVEMGCVVLRCDLSCLSQPNPIFTACLYIPAANGLHTEAASPSKSAGSSVQLGQGGNPVISRPSPAINELPIKIITSGPDLDRPITSLLREIQFGALSLPVRRRSPTLVFTPAGLESPFMKIGGVFSRPHKVPSVKPERGCVMRSRGWSTW